MPSGKFDTWQQEHTSQLEERALDVAINEMQDLDLEELENHQDTIRYYQDYLGLDAISLNEAYSEILYDAQQAAVAEYYEYDDFRTTGAASKPVKMVDETKEIRSMFDSLRQE